MTLVQATPTHENVGSATALTHGRRGRLPYVRDHNVEVYFHGKKSQRVFPFTVQSVRLFLRTPLAPLFI